jgi:hypothetical protein
VREGMSSSILPSITNEILIKNKLRVQELDYIAITIGPGSFTGLRVGLSLAQGLAYSADLSIASINLTFGARYLLHLPEPHPISNTVELEFKIDSSTISKYSSPIFLISVSEKLENFSHSSPNDCTVFLSILAEDE